MTRWTAEEWFSGVVFVEEIKFDNLDEAVRAEQSKARGENIELNSSDVRGYIVEAACMAGEWGDETAETLARCGSWIQQAEMREEVRGL